MFFKQISGKDDENMCEMCLEETGLTRRANAEIVEREFEEPWTQSGGREYHMTAIRNKQARPTWATQSLKAR